MIILLILIALVVLISLSSIAVHYPEYAAYKITYNALTGGEYVWDGEVYSTMAVFSKPGTVPRYSLQSPIEIIYFRDNKSVKLIGNGYIFSYLPTYFDPYTWYWKTKFDKWFKENESKFVNK